MSGMSIIEGGRGRKSPRKDMVGVSWLEMWKNLPKDLRVLIVNKLNMLEVFRMGSVCKDFSDLWKGLVNLDFGRNFMKLIDERGFHFGEDITSRIISGLYGPVDSFHLHITSPDHIEHVQRWIQFLSENHVKNLAIGTERFLPTAFRQTVIKLPSDILKCTNLQRLSLSFCDLTPLSGFQGFVNLISLKLKEVTITQSLLQAIVHKSPCLQELNLDLRCKDGPVIIDACLLKTFYLDVNAGSEFWRLRLRGKCSNLTVAFILSDLEIEPELPGNDKLNQFFNLLPNVEMLTLTGVALMTLAEGNAPTRLVRLNAHLQNLKELDIYGFELHNVDCVACALCIIRSSPNLKSFGIGTSFNFDDTTDEENETFYENQGSVEISGSLSKLHMDIHVADYHYLQLVRIMLKCCPALETVYLLMESTAMNPDEELSVIETILGYPRPELAVIKFRLAWEKDHSHMFNRHEERGRNVRYYWVSD